MIVDYKVFSVRPKSPDEPNELLMLTYKNMAGLDKAAEEEAVAEKVIGSAEVQDRARVERTEYRKVLGMFCLYLVISVSTAYEVGQIESHPHQPVSIDWLPDVGWFGFWSFVIGLPILALILGIAGVLPGTRRKSRYDHVA